MRESTEIRPIWEACSARILYSLLFLTWHLNSLFQFISTIQHCYPDGEEKSFDEELCFIHMRNIFYCQRIRNDWMTCDSIFNIIIKVAPKSLKCSSNFRMTRFDMKINRSSTFKNRISLGNLWFHAKIHKINLMYFEWRAAILSSYRYAFQPIGTINCIQK